jgi:hypothetical protein
MQNTTFIGHLPTFAPTSSPSNLARWTGRFCTGLPLLFLAVDGVVKFSNQPQVVEASARLGFSGSSVQLLGAIELVAVLCMLVHRLAPLGAVLASAYLGGAVATHVSHGDPLFSHVLMPVYFAALIWGGLCLRDERFRALSPFRR